QARQLFLRMGRISFSKSTGLERLSLAMGMAFVLGASCAGTLPRHATITIIRRKPRSSRRVASNVESQRDSGSKPRVASLRATLGQTKGEKQPRKGCGRTGRDHTNQRAATPLGLLSHFDAFPR